MKLNNILSSALPEIDESIKECVNLGQWLLFKSKAKAPDEPHVIFYLKTTQNIFGLNENGRVIKNFNESKDISVDELFYFSDLPQPQSLSNTSTKVH